MNSFRLLLLLALAAWPASAAEDFLRGSVVKSDVWKMDRVKDLEIFDGNVSFRNPRYTLKADNALYARPAQAWTMKGAVYMLRRFDDKSQVEVECDKAYYLETLEEAGASVVFVVPFHVPLTKARSSGLLSPADGGV